MKKSILFSLIFLLSGIAVHAQHDQTMHFMPTLFQSMRTNPAFRPDNKVTLQLPIPLPFPNLALSLSNSAFRANDFLNSDPDVLIGKLDPKNYISFNMGFDLFALRFKAGSFDFNITAGENLDYRLIAPGDFFKFLRNGNGAYLGQTLYFDGLGMDFIYYHDLGFGFSQRIRNLTYGVKFKYLVGVANLNTEKANISMYTSDADTSNYAITGNADVRYNTGGIDTSSNLDYAKVAFNPNNSGFGLDLGASYDINEKFTVNASLINAIGYINWKDNVHNYYIENGTYTFSGVRGDGISSFTDLDTKDMMEDVKEAFKLKQSQESYKTRLTPRMFLSGVYKATPKNRFGFLFSGDFYEGLKTGYTFSYHKQFGRHWNLCFTYAIINKSYSNVGVGTSLRIAAWEGFIITDNIISAIKPLDVKGVNLRMGVNWVFGRPKKGQQPAEAQPQLEVKSKGQAKDRDNDFVSDENDQCPDLPGLFKFNGCPDNDGDGIEDSKDACPALAGIAKFNGCPDKDNDGVPDSKDDCPDRAGEAFFNGCPDTDKDSIPDSKDACPGVKGLAKNNGCPDKDGDGVVDSDDECPEAAGAAIFMGCPDTDKDSVPDVRDKCPDVAGVPANNGCPADTAAGPAKAQLTAEEEEVVNKVFSNLEFETGNAVIKPSSFPALDALYDLLVKRPKFKLQVSGYTDNVGEDAYNLNLSQERADAVKKYLIGKGVEEGRITAKGYGKVNPVASNETEEGRTKNRRVEFTVLE